MNPKKYETYKKLKMLGEGSFGKAYLVECESDKSKCVIKEIDVSRMSEKERKETLQEAKILEALKHPNIVHFREVYTTKTGKLCIVMNFADGGDLQKKLKDNKGKLFTENQILDWFTQICLALKHVHDKKILHRDIKAQNVFLTKTNTCLLGDFGIAKVLANTKDFAKTYVGTPYYLSPEIIENKRYGFRSDIWSLGVLLYELCTLKPPFDAPSLNFLAMKIVRGTYPPIPSHYSRELKNLVSQMLTVDPNKRPSIQQIVSSQLIQARTKNFLRESACKLEINNLLLHKPVINPGPNFCKPPESKQDPAQSPFPKGLLLQSPKVYPPSKSPLQNVRIPSFALQNIKERELEREKLARAKDLADRKKEEEKKNHEEQERKRLDEEKKRNELERKKQEEPFHRKREEHKSALIPPQKFHLQPEVNAIQNNNNPLNRPKLAQGIVAAPIVVPVVNSNARVCKIKQNLDKQLGLLKEEKKKVELHMKNKEENKKQNNKGEDLLNLAEDAKKHKVNPSAELRKIIKEEKKKLALNKELEKISGSSQLSTDVSTEVTKAVIPEKLNQEEDKDIKNIKSKKKNSFKKDSQEKPKEEKKEEEQEEMNNFLWMRKEMEKIVNNENQTNNNTPENSNEENESVPDIIPQKDINSAKDEDRDDVKGEEEYKTPGCDIIKPKNDIKIIPKENIEEVKHENMNNEKENVREYLISLFGKENVQQIVNHIKKINEETNYMGIDIYHKGISKLISQKDLENNIVYFITILDLK